LQLFNNILSLKMKRFVLIASAILLTTGLASSCKKSESNPMCTAGAGGTTQIVVYAVHNGDTIIHSAQQSDTAFVAWADAGDPPNPSYYDKFYVAEAGEDHIHLSSLNCGRYYIRLSVFDSVAMQRFTGSTSISYTKTSGEVEAAVNVN
jgi:hypothetical protein